MRQSVNTSHVSNYIPTTSAVLMDLSSDDGSGKFEKSVKENRHIMQMLGLDKIIYLTGGTNNGMCQT